MTTDVLRRLLETVNAPLPVQVYLDHPAAGDRESEVGRWEGYFEIESVRLELGWSSQGSYPCLTLSLGREI